MTNRELKYELSPGVMSLAKALIGDGGIVPPASYTSEFIARKARIIDYFISHELALEMDARMELMQFTRNVVYCASRDESNTMFGLGKEAAALLAKLGE